MSAFKASPPPPRPRGLELLCNDVLIYLQSLLDVASIAALHMTRKNLFPSHLPLDNVLWEVLLLRDMSRQSWQTRAQLHNISKQLKAEEEETTSPSLMSQLYRRFASCRGGKLLGLFRDINNGPRGGWLRIFQCPATELDPSPRVQVSRLVINRNGLLQFFQYSCFERDDSNDQGVPGSLPFLLHSGSSEVAVHFDIPDEVTLNLNCVSESSTNLATPFNTSSRGSRLLTINFERVDTQQKLLTFPALHREVCKGFHNRVFSACYGPHGQEFLHVTIAHEQVGWVLRGKKIIGDPNVPAGEDSFIVRLCEEFDPRVEAALLPEQQFTVYGRAPSVEATPADIPDLNINFREDRLPLVKHWWKGDGQINRRPGLWQPELTPISFCLYNNSGAENVLACSVLWMDTFHVIDFYNADFGTHNNNNNNNNNNTNYDFDWLFQ